jgi:hypothetical protein
MNDYGVYKRGSKAWGMESVNDSGMQQGVSMSRKSKKKKTRLNIQNASASARTTAPPTPPDPTRSRSTTRLSPRSHGPNALDNRHLALMASQAHPPLLNLIPAQILKHTNERLLERRRRPPCPRYAANLDTAPLDDAIHHLVPPHPHTVLGRTVRDALRHEHCVQM